MKFRQRVAWVLVALYLAATCGVVYYVFEISDVFNEFALDHIERYHSEGVNARDPAHRDRAAAAAAGEGDGQEGARDGPGADATLPFVWHVADVPLAAWLVLLLLPYLQVFCMLLACTKPQPRVSMAFLWPAFVYLRIRHWYARGLTSPPPSFSSSFAVSKAFNSPVANGHPLLDT